MEEFVEPVLRFSADPSVPVQSALNPALRLHRAEKGSYAESILDTYTECTLTNLRCCAGPSRS